MTKSELISKVHKNYQFDKATKVDIANAIEGAFDVIMDALVDGETVKIGGFGVFEAKDRAERAARDIKTGDPIVVPAHRVATFRPSEGLKAAVK